MAERHRHHIVPRHLGGSDHSENMALLNPLEHAEVHAHRFLRGEDSWFDCRHEGWSLLDEDLKTKVLERLSSHNPMKNPETARKTSEALKGKASNHKGYRWSEEQRENFSRVRTGLKRVSPSEETRRKISESLKKRKSQ